MKSKVILIVFLLISGCSKNNDQLNQNESLTKLNLTIKEDYSGILLPNQKFEIVVCRDIPMNIQFYDCEVLDTLISDSEAKIFYDFIAKEHKIYQLKYRPFFTGQPFNHQSPVYYIIEKGRENKRPINLRPTSKLGIRLKHVPSNDEGITFDITRYSNHNNADFLGPYSIWGTFNLDQSIDTLVFTTVMQNESYKIKGKFHPLSLSNPNIVSQDVNIGGIDTTYVEFEF
jgi:hypothetical protein